MAWHEQTDADRYHAEVCRRYCYGAARRPVWYDEKLKPCGCGVEYRQLMRVEDAPSDGAWLQFKCEKCGQEFCREVEG